MPKAANAIEIRRLYLDKPLIKKTLDRSTLQFLQRAGAQIRDAARNPIQHGNKPAPPGRPPKSHTGRLKNNIFFAIQPHGNPPNCVIGPTKLNSNNHRIRANRDPIAAIIERGGMVEILEEQYPDGSWHAAGLRKSSARVTFPTRWKRYRVAPRPYMRPALITNKSRLAGLWRGLFKKGT